MASSLHAIALLVRLKRRLDAGRRRHRLESLRNRGMHIGRDVNFVDHLYVDEEYCALISIGDSTFFGPECMILAHDAGPEIALGAMRVGTVVIHPSCHIGGRTIILPGVEIGPRTVIAASSVVSRSLPADTVCGGRPARPFSTLARYLETHRQRIEGARTFEYLDYESPDLAPERRAALVSAARAGDVYMVGGRSAELKEIGGSERTPLETYVPTPPIAARSRQEQR
jgi:maltose O-acetyltransferase